MFQSEPVIDKHTIPKELLMSFISFDVKRYSDQNTNDGEEY